MTRTTRPNTHMITATTSVEIITTTYTDFLGEYGKRLTLIHKNTLQLGDLPEEKLSILPNHSNEWIPVRFEHGNPCEEFGEIIVEIVHDGGANDGKPFSFPGAINQQGVKWNTVLGEED